MSKKMTNLIHFFLIYLQSVNELCEEQGWGVEVTGGHIGKVTVTVPWNALLIDDSSIEVTNLQISLKPKPRETDGASMLESMWSSVSSSMQLAKECLENEGNGADVNQLNAQNPIEGLEKFAQTIENSEYHSMYSFNLNERRMT